MGKLVIRFAKIQETIPKRKILKVQIATNSLFPFLLNPTSNWHLLPLTQIYQRFFHSNTKQGPTPDTIPVKVTTLKGGFRRFRRFTP